MGFLRILAKIVFTFVLVTVAWVGLYRFVPVPFTWTMMGDLMSGHTITKDWMPLSEMDPDMARAAIAGEDSRFCSHHGFDFKAIAGAAARNAQGGRIRGGSTISQQTAKNAFLFQGGGYWRCISTSPRPGSGRMARTPGRSGISTTTRRNCRRPRRGGSPRYCRCRRSARQLLRTGSCGATGTRCHDGFRWCGTIGWIVVCAEGGALMRRHEDTPPRSCSTPAQAGAQLQRRL